MMASVREIPIDEELVRRAERIAAARNMSLPDYLERLIRVATAPPPTDEQLGPITGRLAGVVPSMSDAEAEQAIYDAVARKHGMRDEGR